MTSLLETIPLGATRIASVIIMVLALAACLPDSYFVLSLSITQKTVFTPTLHSWHPKPCFSPLDNKNDLNSTLGINDMSSASIHVHAQFCIWKSDNRRKKTFRIYFSVKKCLERILKSPFCTCTWTIALSLAKKVWKKSLSGIFYEDQRIWEWGMHS